MRKALFEVVNNGTARKAQVEGYTIGGKTGTAEKLPRNNGKYLLSFIGFAPVENPQVVVYVTVDEPNVEDQAGSGLGTIIAHSVFEELLPYMNIYQSGQQNESVGEDIGDETSTPIFEGEVPNEQLSQDMNQETTESTETTGDNSDGSNENNGDQPGGDQTGEDTGTGQENAGEGN